MLFGKDVVWDASLVLGKKTLEGSFIPIYNHVFRASFPSFSKVKPVYL